MIVLRNLSTGISCRSYGVASKRALELSIILHCNLVHLSLKAIPNPK